jgi:hypothetical protein
MDYSYENLSDERFQELCSCLISKEFPNIQSFPVGQPDGGRDILVYQMNSIEKEFIVFQVKFVRNANQERDVHKWLTEVIKGEVEKINKLIPKGAKSYYLLTNVRGTAHLDSGSKDKVNNILEENISIPSICWWRDDLSTLFEKDPMFKWSFLEIVNGQDILNFILFEHLQENKERRGNVIRAYLIDQFEIDNEVKFKQIDLKNRLFDLFTDVPVKLKKINEKNKSLKRTLYSIDPQRQFLNSEDNFYIEEKSNMGAAEFLLHSRVQNEIERVLLEGGPGQGKSTISQYISQVHRARLLNKSTDIELLPDKIKHTPVRLPFKIDLRDIASWVGKKNPYDGNLSQDYFDQIWKNSLESFLVYHIFYHSKLEEFTSTDFIAICKLSPILLVFDGFDEIADIKIRSEVIDFINKGITRISANTNSIQVIVTSRPAALTNSVGFSIDNYPHFELTDITTPIINQYVEKWIKASNLNKRDANELKKLIKDKLDMPHLKDLAKSPMQLAIFISLLRTKGQSLPNKRTALYDSYIDLVFDRESEKSSLIREKRDLIIDIHQYLAWVLHSEAELFNNNGSIHIEKLNSRLKEYLSQEGHDITISEQLFDAMKERVCALVSRVQGTFEFEVQPLREYFCAKYLYKSAPHSSAGAVKMGTKPDRLHAILRNNYWQNVVRFFVGCADAGELDMIIQELKELQKDELLKLTNYPRILTAQILSDYVFTQKPLKLKDVVKIIVDGINIGNIINQDGRFDSRDPLLLPHECGRIEVINECFEQLISLPNSDYANELIGIINNNPLNNLENWLRYYPNFKGESLTIWYNYAYQLKLIHKIEESLLVAILKEGDKIETQKRIELTINGNRIDIIDRNKELKNLTFFGILDGELNLITRQNKEHSLNFLTLILHPDILAYSFKNEKTSITFMEYITRLINPQRNSGRVLKKIIEFEVNDEVDKKIFSYCEMITNVLNFPIERFKSEIEPWDLLVEASRSCFKDNWALKIVATIAASIKSKDDLYDEYIGLHDSKLSLCKRVRCARLKSGNIKYWEFLLSNKSDINFTLLVFFTWATPKTIVHLIPTLSKIVKILDAINFTILTRSLNSTVTNSFFNKSQQSYITTEFQKIKNEDEIKYLLSLRFDQNNGVIFIYNNIEDFNGVLANTLEPKFEYLITTFLKVPSDLKILEEIKSIYKKIKHYDVGNYHYHSSSQVKIPYEIAKMIMLECKNYPKFIAVLAEKSCRLYANSHVKPIGEIAKNEKWFEGN